MPKEVHVNINSQEPDAVDLYLATWQEDRTKATEKWILDQLSGVLGEIRKLEWHVKRLAGEIIDLQIRDLVEPEKVVTMAALPQMPESMKDDIYRPESPAAAVE